MKKLQEDAGELRFVYGRSYLERNDAISLDMRELPLESGVFRPRVGEMHSVIRDASPDAWGRKVLLYRLKQDHITELDYLLNAGTDQYPVVRNELAAMWLAGQDNFQLFRRMMFNILIGNNDDHARNHAFFWDGSQYELTPAYDICPMLRTGLTANQAMIVGKQGRSSTLKNALSEAGLFGLTREHAILVKNELIDKIETLWAEASDCAGLTKVQSDLLRSATVLSPGIYY